MRRPRALALALSMLALAAAPASASVSDQIPESGLPLVSEVPSMHVGTLSPGDELFWDGTTVEDSLNPAFTAEGCEVNPLVSCFDYTIDVAPGGERLRVAHSDPEMMDIYELFLYDPNDINVGSGSSWYSYELFAYNPIPGSWRVRVVAASVENSSFRMRAKLEAPDRELPGNRPARDLLPNLRPIPPFEFGFEAPHAHTIPIGTGVDNMRAADSCSVGERVHTAAQLQPQPERCLRFTAGPQNIGEGLLDLVYTPGSPTDPAQMTQLIHRTEGDPRRVPAGQAEFHQSHAHYHVGAVGVTEIFRVVAAQRGEVEYLEASDKQGFCLGHFMIPEWFEFTQDPVFGESTCMAPGVDTPTQRSHQYLTAGWGDIYNWGTDFNFIDHHANGDGEYVVRYETDPDNYILESDERDNTAYAYISIHGDDVQVLERGFGTDPWDPRKKADESWTWLRGNADPNPLPYTDLK